MKTLCLFAAFAANAAFAAMVSGSIEVVDGNNMPLVEATLDGVKCTLLLDTGASHTTFDIGFVTNKLPNAALQDVQLVGATNVRTPPKFVAVKSLDVCGQPFEIQGIMALDLGHLPSAVRRPVDGILGMDILRRAPCVISLSRRKLIWNPDEDEIKGFTRVPSQSRGLNHEILAKLPSGKIQPLLLDTGSSFTFLNCELWPASEEKAELTAASVNGRSDESNSRGKPGALEMGTGFTITVNPVLTKEPNLNQIGSDVFRRVDILLVGTAVGLRQ